MDFESILVALSRAQVRYLVAGGVGVVLSGHVRLTADLDLVLDLASENLRRFLDVLRRLRYRPRLPVPADQLLDPAKRRGWVKRRNLKAFTFICEGSPLEDIDVLLTVPIRFSPAWNRRQTIRIRKADIPIASVDDLITMKESAWEEAHRDKDRTDLDALRFIRERRRNS